MDSFIARQPIFDEHMNVYAYELLYRSSAAKNSFDAQSDADNASSKVIMDSFQDVGLDRVTGGRRAFINFTSTLLEQNVATLFPNKTLVIEVLENVSPTAKMLANLKQLRAMGYQIALDDFEYLPSRQGLLEIADIVKIDFIAMDTVQIRDTISHLGGSNIRLLAEKLETYEDFELAKALGFTLFQGYFFSKPVILENRRMEPGKLSYLQLLRQVWQRKDLDYRQLAGIIKRDMALSYKMLRMVNSAYYGQRREVKDIQHALVVLGEVEIRKWVSLIAMAGCNEGRPSELIRESLVRARFMELYAAKRGLSASDAGVMFLCGLLSLIDAVMQQPMGELIAKISVPVKVEQALIKGEGDAAILLVIFRQYERGDWDAATELYAAALPQPGPNLPQLYLEAVEWCNALPV